MSTLDAEGGRWAIVSKIHHCMVDDVAFGVTADYDSSADLDVFVGGIRRGLAELSD
jgi:hypothetical protein